MVGSKPWHEVKMNGPQLANHGLRRFSQIGCSVGSKPWHQGQDEWALAREPQPEAGTKMSAQ